MSIKENHQFYLNQCLELAYSSVEKGNHPFGALLVLDNVVVVTSENEVETLKDVTAHAELRLVQKAQSILRSEEIKECTLYTSTEPCAMCAGAIYWVGIKNIVYGCSTNELFNIVKDGLYIHAQDIFQNSTSEINLIESISNSKFIKIHRDFW